MSNRPWKVRKAVVDDASEVAEILHAFNTEFDTPTPEPAVLATRLRTLLASSTTFALLAGDPGDDSSSGSDGSPTKTAVGLALVTLRPSVWYEGPIAILDELYVVPHLRGHGVGTALMDELVAIANAINIGSIEINVDESDVDALRFYVRHGYTASEPDTGERAFFLFREFTD